jgi:hypothetical protein
VHDNSVGSAEEHPMDVEDDGCHSLVHVSRRAQAEVHTSEGRITVVTRPLPKVLILHTGGGSNSNIHAGKHFFNIYADNR